MIFSEKTYRVLNFIAQILLPALGTLYFGLAAIWNLPAPEKIIGTITVVDTFLGVMLGISQTKFKQQVAHGIMKVDETPTGKTYSLVINDDPEYMLDGKTQVRFNIEKTEAPGPSQ